MSTSQRAGTQSGPVSLSISPVGLETGRVEVRVHYPRHTTSKTPTGHTTRSLMSSPDHARVYPYCIRDRQCKERDEFSTTKPSKRRPKSCIEQDIQTTSSRPVNYYIPVRSHTSQKSHPPGPTTGIVRPPIRPDGKYDQANKTSNPCTAAQPTGSPVINMQIRSKKYHVAFLAAV